MAREPWDWTALETAVHEGCPETLFRGLCDWIEDPKHIVDSDVVEFRYSPNTRALALQRWRLLNMAYRQYPSEARQ